MGDTDGAWSHLEEGLELRIPTDHEKLQRAIAFLAGPARRALNNAIIAQDVEQQFDGRNVIFDIVFLQNWKFNTKSCFLFEILISATKMLISYEVGELPTAIQRAARVGLTGDLKVIKQAKLLLTVREKYQILPY